MALNINGFPTEHNGEEKAKRDKLKDLATRGVIDILGLTETARNEDQIEYHRRPTVVLKTWTQDCIAEADWLRSSTRSHEPGGVLMSSAGSCTAHRLSSGKDERRLGRWIWTT